MSSTAVLVGAAEPATFFRGLNLNGPAVMIDSHPWDGAESPDYECTDKAFENQTVPLVPPIDAERTRMIRSSRWGGNKVALKNVPAGAYSVLLYVWEDNNNETFSVSLNGKEVARNVQSGQAGHWQRLGPWPVVLREGEGITLSSRGGAANFSGIEVWNGQHDGSAPWEQTPEGLTFFESKIRPLLIQHCYECHSAEAKDVGGELFVDARFGLRRGGGHGPAIVPGDVERSLLIKAVRYGDKDLQMPPAGQLPAEAIADLEAWVRMYAPDPRTEVKATRSRTNIDWEKARDWWSLRPIQRSGSPSLPGKTWPRNDIDRFILARLEQAGLDPADDTDPRVWLRRVTFDLTGLPPSPEEIDAYLADQSVDAERTVVDRLLASPQYGERWGRHWLDVVRYADTAGDNSDFPIPQMYRYRNWVIDAFNRDLPYDQFVTEQLAGDLLGGATDAERHQRLIATGYIANARRFGSRVDDYPQHLTIEDTLDNLGRTFLASSLNCARCHHHKFDPITTDDYYALYGIFHSTRYPWPGIELEQKQRDLIPLVSAEEVARVQQEREQQRDVLKAEVQRLEKEREALSNEERKTLDQQVQAAQKALKEHEQAALPYELAYAVAEARTIEDAAIQLKGDPNRPGPVIARRFLTVLSGAELPNEDRTSGRLALAKWITDPANPLTARVMVNRLWQGHFGKGLVPTSNDFGHQGKPPSHPELLDWLAVRFIDLGWSMKALHREIVLSRTYRLSGRRSDLAVAGDPANEFLSSFPRRRLDAEALRDTLLLLGGHLDPSPGGPHPFPSQSTWKFTQHNPFKAVYDTNRRSVYLMTQRIQRHPYLAIFDGADPSASTPFRLTSTTPLQALYLLNDAFVHDQAHGLAERVLQREESADQRIERLYRLTLGRFSSLAEREHGQQFLAEVRTALTESGRNDEDAARESWEALCRALFRLNEFVYLD